MPPNTVVVRAAVDVDVVGLCVVFVVGVVGLQLLKRQEDVFNVDVPPVEVLPVVAVTGVVG